jgi:hypothetical protein
MHTIAHLVGMAALPCLSLAALAASGQLGPVDVASEPGAVGLPTPPGLPPIGEDSALPKSLTSAEAEFIRANPIVAEGLRGLAPEGLVRCPAEYEPMEGILMAYEGSNSWKNILEQMAVEHHDRRQRQRLRDVRHAVEANQVQSAMAFAGADPNRVFTFVRSTDTIWMRDYGPRYIYEGNGAPTPRRARVVDHTYNRPRPNDNLIPDFWAGARGEAEYQIPLVHGGGNYHLSAVGRRVRDAPDPQREPVPRRVRHRRVLARLPEPRDRAHRARCPRRRRDAAHRHVDADHRRRRGRHRRLPARPRLGARPGRRRPGRLDGRRRVRP